MVKSGENKLDHKSLIIISHLYRKYFPDNALKDLKDELDFQSDIDAIASVIAYKEKLNLLLLWVLFGN